MLRLLILSVLSLFILSCTGSSGDSQSPPKMYYTYGSKSFSGNITPLNDNYRPKDLSSKVFTSSGQTYAPMNFLSQNLEMVFDPQNRKAQGKSAIRFLSTGASAFPYFQLLAPITEAKLNGVAVTTNSISDPDGQKQTYQSVNQALQLNEEAVLEIYFELPEDRLTYINGGVRYLTDMTDLYSAEFFENWGPANFEEDEFEMTAHLKVISSTAVHKLFANGEIEQISSSEWKVHFPSYFTTSSFYMHLTERALTEKKFVYKGLEKDIPITVYSLYPPIVDAAVSALPGLFKEFESDFGPYPHASFVAYMHSGSGGMEYSGATITGFSALDHELFHSWFARSVKPAEGRSGWIDEAFASWRDYGYFQAPSLLSRTPTLLSGFSAFRKSTPENCYRDGRQLIAELDRYFADYGGMKPLMKVFFERYKNRIVTNEEFWNFLNTYTQLSVDDFFLRYTMKQMTGNDQQQNGISENTETTTEANLNDSKHPARLTREEILKLR